MAAAKENKLPYTEFIADGVPGIYPVEGSEQKGFRLIFDFNELEEAERVSGYNLLFPLRNIQSLSASQTRAVLFALLKSAHPKVTLNDAGDLLSRDYKSTTKAMWKILKVDGVDEDELFNSLQKLTAEDPLRLAELLNRLRLPVAASPPVHADPPPADVSAAASSNG